MTPSGARLIIVSIAFSCALFLAATPRAVIPLQPPYPTLHGNSALCESPRLICGLTLRASSDAADEGSEKPPGSDPATAQLMELLLERGAAEIGKIEPSDRFAEREARIRLLVRSLENQIGEDGLRNFARQIAMRVERGILGLQDEDPRLIARLDRQLEIHHASVNGELIAPPPLIRAFALARLSIIFDDARVDRFMTPCERELYYGWAAVFGEGEVRRFGEEVYEKLRPDLMLRLHAYRAFHAGAYEEAALLYRRIFEERGAIAARNYALAATSLARSGG